MPSLNTMVKKVAGLADTTDVNDWENQFIKSVVEQTANGDNTTSLTEKQVGVLERIYNKNFAG
ncbi:MAG: hypothetical protein KF686_03460 [Ramlibacter sp.]|nr:hypothetical protein [Ramlibacter sp.]